MKRRLPRDRPQVSVNFAVTWDGRITTRAREPANFSSPHDKHRLLEIRALADAVMVSARTAASDTMTIGLPDAALRAERLARGQAEYPLRVLVTNSGRISPELRVFTKDFSPIVIFSTERMPRTVRARLAGHAELRLAEGEHIDLPGALRILRREYLVRRLHCEGGGELFRSLAAAGLVDEIYLTVCPRIFGGLKTPTLTGAPADFLPRSLQAKIVEMQVVGQECYLRYRIG